MDKLQEMKKYAVEDFNSAVDKLNNEISASFAIKKIKFSTAYSKRGVPILSCTAVITEGASRPFKATTSYSCIGSEIWADDDVDDIAHSIFSASDYKKTIIAADDDMDDDMDDEIGFDDASYDDSLDDALDDVQDKLEDIQESVDEVQEDDVSIEMDTNISGHYIAECDSCHNVFISAVTESSQQIEKVTGVCPVCNKESDQYLKWIIKDIK